ncbi:stage II sporulation protein P [Serpentinicella sp. ANB-PHB4]|uniref:stage II sporulation protein P n=1 Tax=Serpentinicella sp. ANB-PHB4 TaxID=3074076 RepID=UPI002856828B|nr:stage II sporulation protein P [Serpentinicella sp. ANB-PHB4]MDR5657908.1 stage II sporulation protein P [Serpentinicella sp. ANB-PHB4]
MKNKSIFVIIMTVLLIVTSIPLSYADDLYRNSNGYYTVFDENDNSVIFKTAHEVKEGDQYLSGDNKLYKITRVDKEQRKAYAKYIEDVQLPKINEDALTSFVDKLNSGESLAMVLQAQADTEGENGGVGLYCTHSSESYVPTDGSESIEGSGGILQVAERMSESFQENGVEAVFDNTSHDPHDSGAYKRSRRTATQLLTEHQPTALLDVHRDAIPAEEYSTEINGEPASQVRLVIGGRNQNFSANEEVALQVKAVADKMYPGLIKDIFYAQGDYNQDLTPRAMLLEMGTYEQERELAEKSAGYFSEVLTTSLFGGTFEDQTDGGTEQAQPVQESNRGSGTGIIAIGVVVGLGALAFLFLSSGGKEWKSKLGTFKEEFNNFLGRKKK